MTNNLNWQKAHEVAQTLTSQWSDDEPGGAILVFDTKNIKVNTSGGLANLNTGEKFSSKTVGRFASVTKHFLCSLVLRHPELISLGDTLGKHLPGLQPALAEVTVEQALSMTAGLPDNREALTLVGLSVYSETSAAQNLEMTERFRRLNFEPGSEISYSNTGYRLVELILESKGVFLKDFLHDALNDQLGTEFDAPHIWSDPVKGLVPGYWFNGEKWLQTSAGLQISAAGSVTACAEHMAIWAQALLAGEGEWHGVLDRLAESRHLKDGTRTGYGLGLMETELGDRAFVGHGGSHPGYKAYVMMEREQGTGVVLLSNRDDTDSRGCVSQVLAALYSLDLPKPAKDLLKRGLYVEASGPHWIKVDGETVAWIDDGGTMYEDDGEWVSSRSATTPMLLTQDGDKIIGKVGHVERCFEPVSETGIPKSLQGIWQNDEGAFLTIQDGTIIMGSGALRQVMPLTALGAGRYLFTLKDSLWTKQVCLHMLDEDRFELVLSRARMIEYQRLSS